MLWCWPCGGTVAGLTQGQGSLTVFSRSFLMFSSLMVTPAAFLDCTPTPPRGTVESTIGHSSCSLTSPKPPPPPLPCTAISTPMSWSLAALRGDGSLLHDERSPGLD